MFSGLIERIRPRNWAGERPKDEIWRRLSAVEGNAQEAHLRLNDLENRLNSLYAMVDEPEKEDDPYAD